LFGLSAHASVSHRGLPLFPTRRSSDLRGTAMFRFAVRANKSAIDSRSYSLSTLTTRPGATRGASHACHSEMRSWSGRRGLRLGRSEEHTSELQSRRDLVCRLLLEKKKE